MNTNQYTQKTLEALQAAQQLAVEYQHNALEPEHLLHALASQEQGLIPQLLQKLNVDPGSFAAAVAEKLSALPRVSGSGRDPDKVYISQATDKVLSAAAREAKAMKDEYVSVEHVFLGLLDEPTQNTTELFRAFNIKKDAFLQQLTAVRGNQRVTNDNPEDTYNALQKYGQDLVDLARKQKLDPVIGRDQEIRNVIRILSRKTKNNPCLIGVPGQPLHCQRREKGRRAGKDPRRVRRAGEAVHRRGQAHRRRVLHRPEPGLCPEHGGKPEAQGDQLYPLRSLRLR